jgi:hypothetical protein
MVYKLKIKREEELNFCWQKNISMHIPLRQKVCDKTMSRKIETMVRINNKKKEPELKYKKKNAD